MDKWEGETGKKYGKLTVLSVYRKNNVTFAECLCDCSKKKTTRLASLKNGDCTSCGCEKRAKLEGMRFGKLQVIKFDRAEKRQAFWMCKCDCGITASSRRVSSKAGKQGPAAAKANSNK